MHAFDEQDPAQDEMAKRMEQLEAEARKAGLYLQGFTFGKEEPADHLVEEPRTFALATFLVGGEAFSDRVLNPQKHEEDTTFRTLAAGADPYDVLKDELQKKREEGKDIFDE